MIKAVLSKVEAVRAALAQTNDTKFIIGRIDLLENHLVAPVKGTPCAFFELSVDELVTRRVTKSRQQGDRTIHYEENQEVWEHRFTEIRCCDFFIKDYYEGQDVRIFVPASTSSVKFYSKLDAGGETGGFNFFQPNYAPSPLMDEILSRHGIRATSFFGIAVSTPRIRFREASFDRGEVVALLGSLKNETLVQGTY